jgi:molecular chaperone GrpE
MSDDDVASAAGRLLAGFDFARAMAASDEAHRRETEALLCSFLEVVDSLEALERHTSGHADDALHKTVERILGQAYGVLARAGVERLVLAGLALDLAYTEVVDVRVNDQHADDTVLEEIVRGYRWRNRLLRRAKVVISRNEGTPAA